ncbi:hypothetical protein G4177_07450 [Corallococcus sp. ZKHCc1 1396]|uniref:Uncharacterized protein n=1 Tax=Corallococcus soli TaxID=2710757 RepID=A0ABR9PJB9_9BACT|nr:MULTISPECIES: hypothetical protein [Corallococcus]MBE4748013.1 hypothetical protein [Corallococcus soli]MCY1033973.1 hypothetical protein [Corallococcus sp. BB11-1]RYZ46988.1 MAG: hypothetical protein EOO72_00625 [Myxococcaceae bacterium]
MRSIDTEDERIATLLVADDAGLPFEGSRDVVVRLRDGRSFVLTVQTLEALEARLGGAPSFVTSRLVLVRRMSDGALLHAVRSALDQGVERFGTLQPSIEE